VSERRTYSQAIAAATPVTIEELRSLLDEDDNPTIWPGPRRPRRIAMDANVTGLDRLRYVEFTYCDVKGYTQRGTIWPSSYRPAVIAFSKIDGNPTVKLVRNQGDNS
jgi:hypothetical protein